jgi:hypothetical protein
LLYYTAAEVEQEELGATVPLAQQVLEAVALGAEILLFLQTAQMG